MKIKPISKAVETAANVIIVAGAAKAIYKEYGYKPFFSHSVLRNSLSNEKYNGWL